MKKINRKLLRRFVMYILVIGAVVSVLSGCEKPADTVWLGEGEAEIVLAADTVRYVAGYQGGLSAAGILDIPMVKAVWMESGGKPVLLCAVDCVGLAAGTVEKLRDAIQDVLPEKTEIHVVSTHSHAAPDTLGLWGPTGIDGKVPEDMEALLDAAVAAGRAAYDDRRTGRFAFAAADCRDLIEDTRQPAVFDGKAYVFRFQPDDGAVDTRLVLFPAHAEALGGGNPWISADFPAYIAQSLHEATGARTVFLPGAIGGLLRTVTLSEDPVENCRLTGEKIAARILSIDGEIPLGPGVSILTEKVKLPCDNILFRGMKFLGILENDVSAFAGKVTIHTTVSLLTIGEKRILLLPGEIFPELVYGTDPAFTPVFPEIQDPAPLTALLGEDLLVIGLCDDEIGYILPPSDFLLDADSPYLVTPPRDHNGENHYEETNSAGVEAAWAIERAVRRLARRIQ